MLGRLCILPLLLALTSPALAQFESDSNLPVEITADAMEWMNEEGIAIARGNADAVQGRYRLRADVLTAYVNQAGGDSPNRIRRIDAQGHVTLSTPTESARGEAGTYDCVFSDVGLNQKDARRYYEQFPRGIASRSLF